MRKLKVCILIFFKKFHIVWESNIFIFGKLYRTTLYPSISITKTREALQSCLIELIRRIHPIRLRKVAIINQARITKPSLLIASILVPLMVIFRILLIRLGLGWVSFIFLSFSKEISSFQNQETCFCQNCLWFCFLLFSEVFHCVFLQNLHLRLIQI